MPPSTTYETEIVEIEEIEIAPVKKRMEEEVEGTNVVNVPGREYKRGRK